MISFSSTLRMIAFIHFLSSTGVRVGAIPDLRVYHITEIENGAIITIYDGDIVEYRTCLTPETYEHLKNYFEYRNTQGYPITKDSPVFCDSTNHRPLSDSSAHDLIKYHLKKCGMKTKGQKRSKNTKSQNHAFRKRFETILTNSDIHSKYIEFMMGHFERQTDRHYFKPTDEDLWKRFKKAIPLLTLSDEFRKNEEINKLQEKITDTETLNLEIDSLKKELFRLRQKEEAENDVKRDMIELEKKLKDSGYI